MSASQRVLGSFRDPSGYLFKRDGTLYRQVNHRYRIHYDHLMDSGLYRELVHEGYLIPHEETPVEPDDHRSAYKVLRPEALQFVSYPYEWCFSQYKDAALRTLQIQKRALSRGMSLKDCSAYNMQFRRGIPVLIDTLSFEIYREGEPWVAYRQFCQHFLGPLALMARRDARLGQLMRVHLDGLPLDLVARLLPWNSRFRLGLMTHVYLHAGAQRRYGGRPLDKGQLKGRMSLTALRGLLESLEGTVSNLAWEPVGTEWGDYYDATNYTEPALAHKEEVVRDFLLQLWPATVWDLGANTGFFSRLASSQGIPTIAWDVDPAAVERNYRACRSEGETQLLPLLLDLANPSPSIGWGNRERMSFLERAPADTVMVLALIHHLAIGNNIPLGYVADLLSLLGPGLIIEFVPKEDSQVRRLLSMREDVFPDYNREAFESAFEEKYRIERRVELQDSMRCVYLMRRRWTR